MNMLRFCFLHRGKATDECPKGVIQSEPQKDKEASSLSNQTEINERSEPEESAWCPICLEKYPLKHFPALTNCKDRCCESCLVQYATMEVMQGNGKIGCPVCSADLHNNDVYNLLKKDKWLLEKFEKFQLIRVLSWNPDMRWCPAPDCEYGVLAGNCNECPELRCGREDCGISFCYNCRARWTENHSCRQKTPSFTSKNTKLCPRCHISVQKLNDWACNHIVCKICGCEFCWHCGKEAGPTHFLFPPECSFMGRSRYSQVRQLRNILVTLLLPLEFVIALIVSVPVSVIVNPVVQNVLLELCDELRQLATPSTLFALLLDE
ncbi:unnamed protein product [Soboliphyme baturini]|uniref:RBR-type E3 ubiquitin transferase n=1 Tax=Soboliphyme baturini TaxID=241478 RepID=A0A183ID66_9BILA|nr:unnamed protein product [Soboliphyme baturini]